MRTALSASDIAASDNPSNKADSYAEQILKYIPAEVVAFYLPALAAAVGLKAKDTITLSYTVTVWVIFFVGLFGTFVYMRRKAVKELLDQKVSYVDQRANLKAGLAMLAFFIWAVYLGSPWDIITGFNIYGTLLILGFTLCNPVIYDAIPVPFSFTASRVAFGVKYNPTEGVKPGNITEVSIINHSSKDLQFTALDLYFGSTLVKSIAVSGTVPAHNTLRVQPQSLSFNGNGDIHIIRLKNLEKYVAASDPISAFKV
jgi:hypothetical protein